MRRVPIWQREGVYYYTTDDGRRISLRTKDRRLALERYREATEPEPEPPAAPAAAAAAPTPAPPSRAEDRAHREVSPGVASSPGDGGHRGGPDPLLEVGAANSNGSSDSGMHSEEGGDGDGGMPLSEEDVEAAARVLAEQVMGGITMISATISVRRRGYVGVVKQTTFDQGVEAWMAITRRWAREWRMGPWTGIALCTFAVCREQWTAENGAVGAEADQGVPTHPSAQAQSQ